MESARDGQVDAFIYVSVLSLKISFLAEPAIKLNRAFMPHPNLFSP